MKQGWEVKQLGDVCETGAGGTPLKVHKDYYEGGTIPWLMSGEVSQGEIFQAKNFITEEGLKNSSAKLFPPNTVLVAMYGATAGQVGILRFEASTNQAVCGVLPNERTIPEYLFYCFLSKKEELISQAVGGAQPNISQIKIKNTKIPLPPLPEQQRIVAILDECFAAIAKAKANAELNLKNAGELFYSYLQSVFENKGEGWEEKSFSELCSIKHGFAFLGKNFSNKGEYILLTPGNFFESGGYRDRGDKQKYYVGEIPLDYVLKKGDLLVAMTEQAAGLLGSPILIPESNRFLHNQRLGLVISKPGIPWTNEFFFHVFNTLSVRKILHNSGTGVKVRHTSPTRIGNVKVCFPSSITEQKEIVATLKNLSIETKKLEAIYQQKINDLEELKKSILHKAFSGELNTDKDVAA